jgi:hypothetical protein
MPQKRCELDSSFTYPKKGLRVPLVKGKRPSVKKTHLARCFGYYF